MFGLSAIFSVLMNRENRPIADDHDPDGRWARLVGDLRAYGEEQRQIWGGLDDLLIARYVARLLETSDL